MQVLLYLAIMKSIHLKISWRQIQGVTAILFQVKQGISEEKKLHKSTMQQQEAELKHVVITLKNEYKIAKQQLKRVNILLH